MLYFNYKRLFELRGIKNPFKYLMENGFSRAKAYKITSSYPTSMKLDNIDKMCTLFSCTPNDILTWVPNKDSQIPENHPLQKLKKVEVLNFTSITKDVPVSQIPELLKSLQEAKAKLNSD